MIDLYYKYSPSIAYQITQSPVLKTIVRSFIFTLVFFINYSIYFIIFGLVIIMSFLLIKRGKNYFGLSSFIFCLFFYSLIPNHVEANISYPSYFKHGYGKNPAVRLLVGTPMSYGVGFESVTRTIKDQPGLYTEKVKEKNISLTGGMYSPVFFADIKVSLAGGKDKDIKSSGFDSTSTSESEFSKLKANIGTSILMIPIGISIEKFSSEHNTLKYKTERLDIGLGSYINFFDFQFGLGLNYISEKGDQLSEAKWVETYIGIGIGSMLTAGKFHGEFYLQRRPEVFNYEGSNYNFHPSKLTIGLSGELSGLALSNLDKAGVCLEHSTESKTDFFIDKDISRTKIELSFAGQFHTANLEWSSKLSLSSLGFAHDDSEVGLNFYISYFL